MSQSSSSKKEAINYTIVEGDFVDALKSSYMDGAIPSDDRYTPRFITNDAESATSLLSVIKQ